MRKKGFTLIEIMLVVSIISLLAVLAIPGLIRARLNTNESTAVSSLRTIASCANSYRAVNPAYPSSLSILSSTSIPYIDSILGNGAKQGYSFSLVGSTHTFTGTARPQIYGTTGKRSFFVDESNVIRYTNADTAATGTDNPLD